MKRVYLSLIIMAMVIGAQPPLWQKAKEWCRKESLVAHKIVISEKVTSKKGKVVEESQLFLGQPQKGLYSFLSAQENGKKVTKRSAINKLKREVATIKEREIYSAEVNPLSYGTVTEITQKELVLIRGHNTVGHSYKQKTADGFWHGVLYIDKVKGTPIFLQASFEQVPFREQGVKIESLSLETLFMLVDSSVVISSAEYTSSIAVKEGILPTFRGSAKNKFQFSNFQGE